jgi:hypothetical protein
MTMQSIGRRLILVTGALALCACGPRAINNPPPQTPASAETSADAGLPAVPLTGKGVIVPSDVKLQPASNPTTPPATATTSPTATPNAN